MAWCLIPEYVDKFKKALQDGEISPEKLIQMTSAERRAYLAQFVGEFNAKYVNTEFESKLLLKNQQRGLITWASKLSGLRPAAKTDIIDKIQKLDKALTPENEKQFLSDIVERRLGVQMTSQEAKIVTDLSKKASDLFDSSKPKWEQSDAYWTAKQQLVKYMREIKPQDKNILSFSPTSPIGNVLNKTANILSVERAVKTGFDLSAPLRQGRNYFGTKEWTQAVKNMFRYAKDPLAYDQLEINMMKNRYSEYALQNKRTLGLTLLGETFTQKEEQYGSSLIEKIPFLRGSERAFTGFLNDLRFHRFVNTLDRLKKAGNDITDNKKAMQDLAKVIGAATGRGTLGGFEQAANSLATVLFSPRWLASRFESLINPVRFALQKSPAARDEAAKSLMSMLGTSVAILGMAKMAGANVELDPRSSDFGRIKVGNTRFDVTGGMGPVLTLVSRLGALSSKSSTTGKISSLTSGKFGQQTGLDVLTSFFTSKTSPVASVIKDYITGQQFGGTPFPYPSATNLKKNIDFTKYLFNQLVVPLLGSDAWGAFHDASGGILTGVLAVPASLFGIGVNTYTPKPSKASTLKNTIPNLSIPALKI